MLIPTACGGGGERLGPAAAPLERVLHLNGVDHWARVAGTALATEEPVVFLHGGPGQGSIHFAALVGPQLESSVRMVYYDQRGSGRSGESTDDGYTISALVEDLEALRRSLDAPRIALIGQSFGGTLALEYAAKYPSRVSAIVFVAGLWDVKLQCRLRNQTLAERAPAAFESVRELAKGPEGDRCLEFQAFASSAELEAYSNEIMYPDSMVRVRIAEVEKAHGYENKGVLGRGLFRSGLSSYRFESFDRLTMPVLVLAGRRDGTARSEGLRELARRLPNARFVEYDRGGHFLYLDQANRFAEDVVRFLTEAQ